MEPFNVLNIWSILDFYMEHSNLHSFYVFIFQDPFISPKKILLIIEVMVLKTTGLNPGFQRKNQFGKICIGSRDIGKKVRNF